MAFGLAARLYLVLILKKHLLPLSLVWYICTCADYYCIRTPLCSQTQSQTAGGGMRLSLHKLGREKKTVKWRLIGSCHKLYSVRAIYSIFQAATYWLFGSRGIECVEAEDSVRGGGAGSGTLWSPCHMDSHLVFILGMNSQRSLLWKEQFTSCIWHIPPCSHGSPALPLERHSDAHSLPMLKNYLEGDPWIFWLLCVKTKQSNRPWDPKMGQGSFLS